LSSSEIGQFLKNVSKCRYSGTNFAGFVPTDCMRLKQYVPGLQFLLKVQRFNCFIQIVVKS